MAQARGLFLAVLGLLFPVAVYAKSTPLTEWIESLRTSGTESQLPAVFYEPLGLKLAGDAPTRFYELFPSDVIDGSGHGATLVFKNGEPTWLLLSKRWQDNERGRSRTHFFRAALDGTLERAIVSSGKVNAAGEGVEGSAKDKILDIASPSVRAAYQRELDLWLKGSYRRKAKKSKSAGAAAAPLPVAGAAVPAR